MILEKLVAIYIIVKGVFIVSLCRDETLRSVAKAHAGFDVIFVGILGIVIGCILLVAINIFEKRKSLT